MLHSLGRHDDAASACTCPISSPKYGYNSSISGNTITAMAQCSDDGESQGSVMHSTQIKSESKAIFTNGYVQRETKRLVSSRLPIYRHYIVAS